jgi:phage shock protein PspC (stress-responsive transcriptional regulator)
MEGTPTTGARPGDAQPSAEAPQAAPTAPPAQPGGPSGAGGLEESRTYLSQKGWVRPREGRIIAGVCAGLARRYDMPIFLVRVLMVAAGLAGFGLIAYLVFWVLMPKEG